MNDGEVTEMLNVSINNSFRATNLFPLHVVSFLFISVSLLFFVSFLLFFLLFRRLRFFSFLSSPFSLPFFHVPFFTAIAYSSISSWLLSHICSRFKFFFNSVSFPPSVSAAKQWDGHWVARLLLCPCSLPHTAAELRVICRETDLP